MRPIHRNHRPDLPRCSATSKSTRQRCLRHEDDRSGDLHLCAMHWYAERDRALKAKEEKAAKAKAAKAAKAAR